jgi:hypothetical protein
MREEEVMARRKSHSPRHRASKATKPTDKSVSPEELEAMRDRYVPPPRPPAQDAEESLRRWHEDREGKD